MHALMADAAHFWLLNIRANLPPYVVFAIGFWLAIWVLAAPLIRARKIRQAVPPKRQLLLEFLFSVRSIVVFSTIGVGITFLIRAGFYPLADRAASWGPLWFWVSFLVMIIAQDAYIYWTHRMMHDPRLFRRFHRRHHRSNNPSPFAAYSFDVGEALVLTGFSLVWPMIFPTPWAVSWLLLFHQLTRNTLLHGGYELMPARRDGRPWLDFLTTTTHHDLHHGQAGYNYGAWFTWWDRWMGTEHPDYYARYAETAGRPYIKLPVRQLSPG